MKALGMFLLKVLGFVVIVLIALWVLALIWGNFRVSPECVTNDTPVVVESGATNDETVRKVPVGSEDEVQDSNTQDRMVLGEEVICQFADDFTAEGLTVPSGTKVVGPALAKPDRNIDWGYPIYVGEEYTTTESDEVIWLLNGDNACVDAQAQYFTYWNKDNPTN